MKRLVGFVCVVAIALILGACSSGNNNASGGNSDAAAIRSRVNSVINHFNSGDAKAILDNDVPASARRTCSDKDAKDAVSQARQALQALGVKLSVKSVDNVMVNGNKATADVTIGGVPGQTSPFQVPFVKDGGTWHLDTGGTNGCNGLILSPLG